MQRLLSRRSIAFLFAMTLALAVAGCSGSDDDDAGETTGEAIEVGALLPLSGALASYGETSRAALTAAVEDLGGESAVNLVIEDTKTDPQTALAKLMELHDQGIKVVIGPYSSSEVREVKDYADENGIILISPLSTSRTLAIADDNVLRFTPDDQQEGVAMAALIWDEGVRVIVPISRDDEGNLGLQSATKETFEALGGTVAPIVSYGADATDFEDAVREVSTNISAYSDGQPVGIYLTAFSEVIDIFAVASTTDAPGVASTPWYGSDSVALSKELAEDGTAAEFAAQAYYPNPILGLSEADKDLWQPVSDRVSEELGREPDAFALAAYDALSVTFTAVTNAGTDADAAQLRAELVSVASGHSGLTGDTRLNAAGDRALGNYDFWSICTIDGEHTWERVATYTASADGDGAVTHLEVC